VSVFESGVTAGRQAGGFRASTKADANARRPGDFIGRAHIARQEYDSVGSKAWRFVAPVIRLTIPVLLLIVSGAAAFAYSNAPLAWLPLKGIGGHPLSLGLVLMPATLFAIHLANRRYGAAYASAQILLAWAVSAATLPFTLAYLSSLNGSTPLPSLREIEGFGAALFVAQFVAAWVFDRVRGRRWWTAPFISSVIGGAILSFAGYPAAYYGTGMEWTQPMWSYLWLTIGVAAVLLLPYWMLRRVVPPTSGFNGY
jgi:uncharacterized PurR-regulated membrane protein YhhQ (DUF165 family)